MDKKVVVHMHNGILPSYKIECIWVSTNEVDETGAYYTEFNKSERETPIQYINTYIWNLERQLTMTLYARQQKRHGLLYSVGEGEGRTIWENSIETCISPYVK